jgi:competence CoiA-like predicted nuclease
MPFVAKDKLGNRINILEYKNPREISDVWSITTDEKLITVCPKVRRAHFRHPSGSSGGESAEHLEAKAEVYFKLKEKYKDNPDYDVSLEHRININDDLRIIDCALLYKGDVIAAYEIQLSQISLETLIERNEDYQKNQIQDIYWLLGKQNRFDEKLTDYLIQSNGYYGWVEIEEVIVEESLF